MVRTVEGIVAENGVVQLLESVDAPIGGRALVLIFDEKTGTQAPETALLSEAALGEDWNRPEEDAAWAHLQRGL